MCCLVVKQTITFCNDDKNWKICIVSEILFEIVTMILFVFKANSLYYYFIIVIYSLLDILYKNYNLKTDASHINDITIAHTF